MNNYTQNTDHKDLSFVAQAIGSASNTHKFG